MVLPLRIGEKIPDDYTGEFIYILTEIYGDEISETTIERGTAINGQRYGLNLLYNSKGDLVQRTFIQSSIGSMVIPIEAKTPGSLSE